MRESDVIRIANRVIDESPRIGRIDADVGMLKSDVAELKSDVAELKSDVAELMAGVHRHGVLLEDQKTSIDRLIEVVMENSKILKVVRDLDIFKQNVTDRQDALECAHRRHVRNRRVHRGVES